MANLKEVRARIKSVQTTQQITKAMKLVSASKLKRAQDRITQMRPYSMKLSEMMSNILASIEGEELNVSYNQVRPVQNVAIVLITADKGLCGGFNSNLYKAAKRSIFEKYADLSKSGNITLFSIGKKGYEAFKRAPLQFNNDYINNLQQIEFESYSEIATRLMDGFISKEFDVIEVVYAKFKNAASQDFISETFLPVPPLEKSEENSSNIDFIFEPNKKDIIEELMPKILKTQFFRYVLDTNASEHGARMVAMDSATNNANELLSKLKLLYNRERQAVITKELLEIVAGAAALNQD